MTATDTDATAVALLRSARALVTDPSEAETLVALALDAAHEREAGAQPVTQSDLFRLLREAYHSVERSRPRRRMRDALVTSLAAEQSPPAAPREE